MNTKAIQIEAGRRCGVEELEKILMELPVEIDFTRQLSARMGIGRIIYINPENGGRVKRVKIDGFSIERQDYLFFVYAGQKYEIKYS